MGRFRGGLTTKIHTLVDALGRPLSFVLTGGQVHDSVPAPELLADRTSAGVIADDAYDNNALRDLIAQACSEAVIPAKCARKILTPHDISCEIRIERFYSKLKHFRWIATRYDRRARYFHAAIHLASDVLNVLRPDTLAL
jgi:transposase